MSQRQPTSMGSLGRLSMDGEQETTLTGLRVLPFEKGYLRELVSLWNKCFRLYKGFCPLTVERFRQQALHPSTFRDTEILLAVGPDGLLGFVHFDQHGGEGDIYMLLVSPMHRGRGIGSRLLSEALTRMPNANPVYAPRNSSPYGSPAPFEPLWPGTTEFGGVPQDDHVTTTFFIRRGFEIQRRPVSMIVNLCAYVPDGLGSRVEFEKRGYEFALIRNACPWREQAYQYCCGPYEAWTAARDGTICARTIWFPMSEYSKHHGKRRAGIWDVAVDSAHRKLGLGSYLLALTLKTLTDEGYEDCQLATTLHEPLHSTERITAEIARARARLYEKAGFRVDQEWATFVATR